MKIVKLNRRYVLGDAGFNYALRFGYETAEYIQLKRILYNMYGEGWSHWNQYRRGQSWGWWHDYKRGGAPYWIGVCNEADITAAIMMIEHV